MPNPHVAIVSTVREPGESFLSWLRYHLAIGFEHVFLFLDDPQDPCREIAGSFPQVTVIPGDDALRARYATLTNYARFARLSASSRYARQMLHMEMATRLALSAGFDWLLHIDDDELFLTPGMTITPHFEGLQRGDVQQVIYMNQEALPATWEIADRFREVAYFKLNPWLVPPHLEPEIGQFWVAQRGHYFVAYDNGKPAVRLRAGLTAKGAHRFSSATGEIPSAPADGACLLHYVNCGYRAFRRKYEMGGRFPDTWPDGTPVTMAFHLRCRDTLASGDESAFRRLYETSVMMDSAAERGRQQALGLVLHTPQPAELLRRL